MNKISNEIENILMNAKKRKIYYEENENIIDELEDIINKFKETKNGK